MAKLGLRNKSNLRTVKFTTVDQKKLFLAKYQKLNALEFHQIDRNICLGWWKNCLTMGQKIKKLQKLHIYIYFKRECKKFTIVPMI
jgi:hypothetical protein